MYPSTSRLVAKLLFAILEVHIKDLKCLQPIGHNISENTQDITQANYLTSKIMHERV